VPIGAWLVETSRRWVKHRNARLAQNWPSLDSRVQTPDVVKGTKFYGAARRIEARFTASYSLNEGGEINYYSGDFSRAFPEEDRPWEWL
jgi:hypothetical protein